MVTSLHGWHKIAQGWSYFTTGAQWPLLEDTIQLGLPVPQMFASVAAAIQFAGGLLIAAGFRTRMVAAIVASTLFTAVAFELKTGGRDAELAGLYALFCLMLIVVPIDVTRTPL